MKLRPLLEEIRAAVARDIPAQQRLMDAAIRMRASGDGRAHALLIEAIRSDRRLASAARLELAVLWYSSGKEILFEDTLKLLKQIKPGGEGFEASTILQGAIHLRLRVSKRQAEEALGIPSCVHSRRVPRTLAFLAGVTYLAEGNTDATDYCWNQIWRAKPSGLAASSDPTHEVALLYDREILSALLDPDYERSQDGTDFGDADWRRTQQTTPSKSILEKHEQMSHNLRVPTFRGLAHTAAQNAKTLRCCESAVHRFVRWATEAGWKHQPEFARVARRLDRLESVFLERAGTPTTPTHEEIEAALGDWRSGERA